MNLVESIAFLEESWEVGGILHQLRQGEYSPATGDRFLQKLKEVDAGTGELIDRRLVANLWFLPQFLEWQSEGVVARSGHEVEYDHLCARVWDQIVELLGLS